MALAFISAKLDEAKMISCAGGRSVFQTHKYASSLFSLTYIATRMR